MQPVKVARRKPLVQALACNHNRAPPFGVSEGVVIQRSCQYFEALSEKILTAELIKSEQIPAVAGVSELFI